MRARARVCVLSIEKPLAMKLVHEVRGQTTGRYASLVVAERNKGIFEVLLSIRCLGSHGSFVGLYI